MKLFVFLFVLFSSFSVFAQEISLLGGLSVPLENSNIDTQENTGSSAGVEVQFFQDSRWRPLIFFQQARFKDDHPVLNMGGLGIDYSFYRGPQFNFATGLAASYYDRHQSLNPIMSNNGYALHLRPHLDYWFSQYAAFTISVNVVAITPTDEIKYFDYKLLPQIGFIFRFGGGSSVSSTATGKIKVNAEVLK